MGSSYARRPSYGYDRRPPSYQRYDRRSPSYGSYSEKYLKTIRKEAKKEKKAENTKRALGSAIGLGASLIKSIQHGKTPGGHKNVVKSTGKWAVDCATDPNCRNNMVDTLTTVAGLFGKHRKKSKSNPIGPTYNPNFKVEKPVFKPPRPPKYVPQEGRRKPHMDTNLREVPSAVRPQPLGSRNMPKRFKPEIISAGNDLRSKLDRRESRGMAEVDDDAFDMG
jgi:hypothetical protein